MTNETKNKPHPYHQVLQWVAEGKELETYSHYYKKWFTADNDNLLVCIGNPNHSSISTYISPIDIRLKPQRHVHQDLIDAFEKGAKVQYWSKSAEEWINTLLPAFCETNKYRIKPKVDNAQYAYIVLQENGSIDISHWTKNPTCIDNLKVVLDGETNKIKSVEIIEKKHD